MRWQKSLAGVILPAAALLAADQPMDKPPQDSRLKVIRHLDDPMPFEPVFTDRAAWEKRRKALREQVLVANGLWPLPQKTPLHPVVHGKIDRDDYTIEKVFFASHPGHYVCGNLYRPKGKKGKLPAVLCPHGHWTNGRFYELTETEAKREIDRGGEKTLESARYPLQARCAGLARLGCVVFFYDMVGYADSGKFCDHRKGFGDAAAEARLQSIMGLQTWNSIRALDFLCELPDVDPKRIAVTGASGGGTQTFILAAIDDRVAVSVPAVMVSGEMQGGCICENCSYLRVGTNNIELAALFAPKPQALIAADDWTRNIEKNGLPQLKSIYRLYDADDKVAAAKFDFPHNYNQVSREFMYNFLNKHLDLGFKEVIREKPFQPVPPQELSVFSAEHPKPQDAVDLAGLRKYLDQASDKQLAEIAKKPDEYRQLLATALRVMVPGEQALAAVLASKMSTLSVKDLGKGCRLSQVLFWTNDEQVRVTFLGPKDKAKRKVIWVHPKGATSLTENGKPVAAAQQLLDAHCLIVCPDLFLLATDEGAAAPKPPILPQKYHKDVPHAAYHYGYNRSTLANRVFDLIWTIGVAAPREGDTVDIIAFEGAGVWALLAKAAVGGRIAKAVIDLAGFDFDQLTNPLDENMLPGALKYGGIMGFVPLGEQGETIVIRPPKSPAAERATKIKGVKLLPDKHTPEQVVQCYLG